MITHGFLQWGFFSLANTTAKYEMACVETTLSSSLIEMRTFLYRPTFLSYHLSTELLMNCVAHAAYINTIDLVLLSTVLRLNMSSTHSLKTKQTFESLILRSH